MLKEISWPNGAEMDILQTMCVKEVWDAELQEKEAMLIHEKDRALMEAVGEREKVAVMVMGKITDTDRMMVKDSKTGETGEVVVDSKTGETAKLYQVVVDSEKTGRLQQRVTMIPLNRIKHRTLPQAKVAQAQRVAPRGQVELTLMLVGYEKSVQEAIEYVFGSTLVCESLEVARKVTFNPAIRARTVTVEGDVFEPSGIVEGWCAGVVVVGEGEQGAW